MIKLCASNTTYEDPEDLISIVINNGTAECDALSCRRLLSYLLNHDGVVEDIDVTDAAITYLITLNPHRYALSMSDIKSTVRRIS